MELIIVDENQLRAIVGDAVKFQLRKYFDENRNNGNGELFTTNEARELLKISRTTENKLNREGTLVPVWVGGRKKYTREAIEAVMQEI